MLKCIFFDSSILERSSIFFFSFSSLNEEISFFLFLISSKKLFGSIFFIFGYVGLELSKINFFGCRFILFSLIIVL